MKAHAPDQSEILAHFAQQDEIISGRHGYRLFARYWRFNGRRHPAVRRDAVQALWAARKLSRLGHATHGARAREALSRVESMLLRTEASIAAAFRQSQSDKAKQPRGGVIARMAAELAGRRDAIGDYLRPAELWGDAFAWLEREGFDPIEDRDTYKYLADAGGRRVLTRDAFRVMLSKKRNPKPSRATR
jgi:hypothetical protein